MRTATAKDLRQRTSALLDTVRRGQEVVITYRGERIAVLAPLNQAADEELRRAPRFPHGRRRQKRRARAISRLLELRAQLQTVRRSSDRESEAEPAPMTAVRSFID